MPPLTKRNFVMCRRRSNRLRAGGPAREFQPGSSAVEEPADNSAFDRWERSAIAAIQDIRREFTAFRAAERRQEDETAFRRFVDTRRSHDGPADAGRLS
jgi:hypothetical protein